MKLKYIKIKPHDFQALAVCSLRYAIGRKSYMPSWIADTIKQNRKFLDEGAIDCLIRGIVNAHSLGDECIDAPVWIDLKNKLEDLRRQNGNGRIHS